MHLEIVPLERMTTELPLLGTLLKLSKGSEERERYRDRERVTERETETETERKRERERYVITKKYLNNLK